MPSLCVEQLAISCVKAFIATTDACCMNRKIPCGVCREVSGHGKLFALQINVEPAVRLDNLQQEIMELQSNGKFKAWYSNIIPLFKFWYVCRFFMILQRLRSAQDRLTQAWKTS